MKSGVPANTSQPDRFLFDRGNEALKESKWLNAREYFRQVVDNYPQSPCGPTRSSASATASSARSPRSRWCWPPTSIASS